MSDDEPDRDERLERFTKETFDRSAAGLDAPTRSRLAQARARALEEASPRRAGRGVRERARPGFTGPGTVAAGAVAAGAVIGIAVALSVALRQDGPVPADDVQLAALDDLEMLAGGDELDMLEEELEFYAWLERQPEIGPIGNDLGDDEDNAAGPGDRRGSSGDGTGEGDADG